MQIPEICKNGTNVKEYLLIVYVGIYWAGDVEECSEHCCVSSELLSWLHVDVLPVDVWWSIWWCLVWRWHVLKFPVVEFAWFNELVDSPLDIPDILGHCCSGEPTEVHILRKVRGLSWCIHFNVDIPLNECSLFSSWVAMRISVL